MTRYRSIFLTACFCLSLAFDAFSKSVLVIAPHDDDEILGFGGVIRTALEENDQVQVVVAATNNTDKGTAEIRMRETIAGMNRIGLDTKYIRFLSFLEQKVPELYKAADNDIIASNSNPPWNQTWGLPELPDYHTLVFGSPGYFTRANFQLDIETIIKGALADDIYTTAFYDANIDHRFLNKFISDAVVKIKRQIPTYSPRMHEFPIHGAQSAPPGEPGEYYWPIRDYDQNVLLPFTMPDMFEAWTPLKWSSMESFPVPQSMSGTPRNNNNLKYQSIAEYPNQVFDQPDSKITEYFLSFVKYDEVFYPRDFSNLAYLATASAGSEDAAFGQTAAKVADGIIDGFGGFAIYEWDFKAEWVASDPSRRWVQLDWPRAYKIDRINLYDRISPDEQVLSGILSFSDGTTLSIGALPDRGGMQPVMFAPKTVSWVRFTVTGSKGSKPGLAEFEVFPANIARQASVSVSSQGPNQEGIKAIDGIRDGFPHDYTKEWAANSESINAWIKLTWPSSRTIDKIVLSDRPNNWERIKQATLTFSSGSPIVINGLSNNGSGNVITFKPRATTWVKLTVNDALGGTTGLSEFEVYEALSTANANYALYASSSCSTENLLTGQGCKKAIDGIKNGFPNDFTKEWATEYQLSNAWIQLNWPQNNSLTKIVLYDRPSSYENITSGTLSFSNGSTIAVGALPNDGTAKTITFPAKSVSWVKFTVNTAQGLNAGLSEMEAF